MQYDRRSGDRFPFGILVALLIALATTLLRGVEVAAAPPVAYVPPRPELRGKVPTEVFGVGAPGRRVVYVFDASGSMAERNQQAIRAAAQEVLQSIGHLSKHQEFAIVAYNETVKTFAPEAGRNEGGTKAGMVFATGENRRHAERFLQSVVAKGNAHHAAALETAYAMKPDVVFLITDSEARLDLTTFELGRVKAAAGKTPCMIVQLGDTKKQSCQNLSRLASETGGRYQKLTYQNAWNLAFQLPTDPTTARTELGSADASPTETAAVQLDR